MHWTQVFLAATFVIYVGVFVAIMVVVRRATGANPRGHARGHGLAAFLNVVATLSLLAAVGVHLFDAESADGLQMFVTRRHIPLLDAAAVQGLGATLCVLAGILLIWGELSLGHSFRVALPESKQPLVTRGVYRFTRNPLALSVNLLALGVLLLSPSWLALVSLVLNILGYEWKIRIEETYLHEVHGAAYAAYCARVGRYLPRLFEK